MSNQGANVPGQTTVGGAIVGGTSPAILFINPNGILAQDPTNFGWDSTNKVLLIEGRNAIYRVPNATADNWFEAGAGNLTLTGSGNLGTGSGALASLTSGNNNTAVGDGSLAFCTTGFNNFGLGTNTLRSITTQSSNVAIGATAMQSAVGTGNIAIGAGSVLGSVTGDGNIGLGSNSLVSLSTGSSNIAIGLSSAANVTDSNAGQSLGSIYIGDGAGGSAIGTAVANTIIGTSTLRFLPGNLNQCTVIGAWRGPSVGSLSGIIALTDGNSGSFGTAIQPALDWNYLTTNVWSFKRKTSAQGIHVYNTFDDAVPTTNYERGVFDWNTTANVLTIGTQAGGTGTLRDIRIYSGGQVALARVPNASGDNWFEDAAGNYTLTGYSNFGTGPAALSKLTSGYQNTAMGNAALRECTTGFQNTAFGNDALILTTTGNGNIAIGAETLFNNTTGSNNIALGFSALTSLGSGGVLTGSNNVAIGPNALLNATNGDRNFAIGPSAMQSMNSTGGGWADNIAIGYQVLNVATGNGLNTVIGATVLNAANPVGNTTAIGNGAGRNFTATVGNCTMIGRWPGAIGGASNVIAISDGSTNLQFDWNWTKSNVWSFQSSTTAQGLHVYNTTDSGAPPTNYERGVFDWNASANVLTIGTQAGGTGTVRDFAITKGGNTFLTSATTTVASLPAAGVKGRHHFVTDANATTFQSIVAGGGTNNVPVFDDGTNWRIG